MSLSPVETLLLRLQCKRLALWKQVSSLLTKGAVDWWVPPHPQPTRTQLVYTSCQVPYGNPHLYSAGSSQRLVDGVAGSQGHLFACADTPQSLAVSSVCSQEPSRGAHCLSMESSPFWLSHYPQSFYQTLGSSSSTFASAGMSDVSVHRRHFPCSGVGKPDCAHPRHQFPLSLEAGFYLKPQEVGPCPVSGHAPLRGSDRHGQGIGFSIPARTEMIIHATQGLLDLTQVCFMFSSGDRAVGVFPCSCSLVHVSSSSSVESSERSLRHEGGSHFEADPLVVSSDPVSTGILVTLGSCVPGSASSTPSSHTRPNDGCIPLMDREWFDASFDARGGGGEGGGSSNQSSLHINFLELDFFPRLEEISEVAVWHTHPGSDRQHYGDALSEQDRRD